MSWFLCPIPPNDWVNGGSFELFLGGEYGFSTLGVDVILRDGCGIQG